MKNLKEFIEKINSSNRVTQEMTKKEIIDCLEIIAQDALEGKVKAYHGKILIDIRYALMSDSERNTDYNKVEKELTVMASTLGRKGGSVKSDAKKKSSAENGKLGGRPKKMGGVKPGEE